MTMRLALVIVVLIDAVEMLNPTVIASYALSLVNPSAELAFAPMASSYHQYATRLAIDKALRCYWSGLDGFTTTDEARVREASGVVGSIYGEATPDGARSIFAGLGLYEEEGVFADLGSGVGKLAAQAYVELPRIDRVLAVELAQDRHTKAKEAWQRFVVSGDAEDLSQKFGRDTWVDAVSFVAGDATETDLDDFGVTHCYVANLCFDDDANARLAKRLAATPSLRKFATLKSLPLMSGAKEISSPSSSSSSPKPPLRKTRGVSPLDGVFAQTRRFKASMTWNPLGSAAEVWLYERIPESPPLR